MNPKIPFFNLRKYLNNPEVYSICSVSVHTNCVEYFSDLIIISEHINPQPYTWKVGPCYCLFFNKCVVQFL